MINLKRASQMPWIDALKGIGILSVIAGHVFSGPVKDIVYAFHMPLFFLVSGYLFKPHGLFHRIRSTTVGLILPSVALVALVVVVFWLLPQLLGGAPLSASGLAGFYGSGSLVVAWFVAVMVISLIAMELLLLIKPGVIRLAIIVLLLVASYINGGFRFIDTPLSTAAALQAIPLFYIGRMASAKLAEVPNLVTSVFPCACVLAAVFPVLGYDMYRGDFGLAGVSLVLSCAMVLSLAAQARLIQDTSPSKVLEMMGRWSLFIMFFHQPLQVMLKTSGIDSEVLRFLLTASICFAVGALISLSPVARSIFFGGGLPRARARPAVDA